MTSSLYAGKPHAVRVRTPQIQETVVHQFDAECSAYCEDVPIPHPEGTIPNRRRLCLCVQFVRWIVDHSFLPRFYFWVSSALHVKVCSATTMTMYTRGRSKIPMQVFRGNFDRGYA